jgi:inorganic triphosphatase YgiF
MPETELKFLAHVSPETLWSRLRKLKTGVGPAKTRNLRSVYYDTPDHALRGCEIALRLRRDGRQWVQTVKSGRSGSGGFSQVGEIEIPAPGGRLRLAAIPDLAVRETLLGRIGQAPLEPVCETVIRRTTREVSLGGSVAEVAVDSGTISAKGRSAEFAEVEIELKDGDPQKLFEIAKLLFPDCGLRFSRLSKSTRGYLLAEKGYVDPPPAPRNAVAIALTRDQTTEEGARDILRECVDQVLVNVEAVGALDDPEGPHQLRVGLRRLRSLFAVFAAVAQSRELERLDDEARWLGREVGRLRDLDVAANDIVKHQAEAHPDEAALTTLLHGLEERASRERRQLRDALAGQRLQDLALDLIRFVETRGWLVQGDIGQTGRLAAPLAVVAGAALSKSWKKVGKRARDIDTLTIEQRHDLRKALKQLRYVIEFFGPLYDQKRVTRMVQRLKRLQDVFGALNDAAMVRQVLDHPETTPADDPRAQRAVGWMLGASEARAELEWAEARDQWRRLRKIRPFWK